MTTSPSRTDRTPARGAAPPGPRAPGPWAALGRDAPTSPLGRRARLGVLGLCGVLLTVTLGVGALLRERHLDQAEATAATLAQVVEQGANDATDAVDSLLNAAAVVARAAGGRPAPAMLAALRGAAREMPFLRDLRVIDAATGAVLGEENPRAGATGPDVEALFGDPLPGPDGFRVGRPQRDAASGEWRVGMSRRFAEGEGAFLVVAHVSLAHLQGLFDAIDVGPNGAVTLIRTDGTLMVRAPYALPNVGRPVTTSRLVTDPAMAGPAGRWRAASVTDGVERLFSYRRLREAPLTVVVALSRADVLAAWGTEAWRVGLLAVGAALLLALVGEGLARGIDEAAGAEAFITGVVEGSGDCIKVLGLDGALAYVNGPGQCALEADGPGSCLGLDFVALFPAGERARVAAALARARAGEPQRFTAPCATMKGAMKWWDVHVTPITDASGRPGGLVVISRDVSAREKAEGELRAARGAAEAANRAKSDFLAAMSHELRTPLSAVIGLADVLVAQEGLPAEARRLVHLQREAGRHLLGVVDNVLDFSKIEDGRVELEAVPVDLAALAEGALGMVRERAVAKGLGLTLAIDEGLPARAVGDPTRLRQVLINLLANAVKFTARGSVHLALAPGEDAVRFAVTDTGPGVPAAKRHLLFQTFAQVDASTTREYGGTGLGLAISKRLAEAMGGRIGVETRAGRGSTFWFEARLPEAAAAAEPERAPAPAAGGRRLRVLVADDVATNQLVARLLLEIEGHEVVTVGNGLDALAAVRAGPPFDAVLMDVQMPLMDGYTAASAIRAEVGAARVPVIGLTAGLESAVAERCRASGMVEALGKPIERAALMAALERWAAPARGPAPAPAAAAAPALPPVLDEAVLGDLEAQLGPASTADLGSLLRAQVEGALGVLAAARGDEDGVARVAHALAGAAGTLGLARLAARAREAERAPDPARADALAAAAREAVAAITARAAARPAPEPAALSA